MLRAEALESRVVPATTVEASVKTDTVSALGAPVVDSGPSAPSDDAVVVSVDDKVQPDEQASTDATEAGTAVIPDDEAPPAEGEAPDEVTNLPWPGEEVESSKGDDTPAATEPAGDVDRGEELPPSEVPADGDKLEDAVDAGGNVDEMHTLGTAPQATADTLAVHAGGTYEATEGGTLELHASVTDRPDANRLLYRWDVDNDGQYDDANGAHPTLVGAQLRALGLFGGPSARQVALRIETAAGDLVGAAAAELRVADAPLMAAGVHLDVTEGQSFNRNVASFKDPGGFEDLSHYAAVINWGDEETSAGTVLRDGSQYRGAGSHTYTHHGNYAVEVEIRDDGGTATVASSTILVHDAGVYAGRTFVRATAGREFTAAVAPFQDQNPAGDVSEFTAEIQWGDGSTSAGTIAAGTNGFQVLGTHIYAAPGDYSIAVQIRSNGGSSATTHSTARVDAVRLVARGLTANAVVDTEVELTLAAFQDADRSAAAGMFTAMIDWADDSTSPATVTGDRTDGFRVVGRHRYAGTGIFSARVAIQDAAGNSASCVGTVRVVGAA